jgi:hypothetical protein
MPQYDLIFLSFGVLILFQVLEVVQLCRSSDVLSIELYWTTPNANFLEHERFVIDKTQ